MLKLAKLEAHVKNVQSDKIHSAVEDIDKPLEALPESTIKTTLTRIKDRLDKNLKNDTLEEGNSTKPSTSAASVDAKIQIPTSMNKQCVIKVRTDIIAPKPFESPKLLNQANTVEKSPSSVATHAKRTLTIDLCDEPDTQQPLKVPPYRKIQVILTTDSKRQAQTDDSAKKVDKNSAKVSISTIDNTIPISNTAAGATKQIQPLNEVHLISNTKKRKIESTTPSVTVDKWIGANDILRRILIEDAKKKSSLSTKVGLPVQNQATISTYRPLSSGTFIPAVYAPDATIVYSNSTNSGNSVKRNSENSTTSRTSTKRFRYEDLYGVSDDE